MADINGNELWPRGGSDVWDDGPAGLILSAEAFGAVGGAVEGTAQGVLEFVGSGSAAQGFAGSANGSISITGTAAGQFLTPVTGTAAGVLVFTGSTAGAHGVGASANGALQLVGASAGAHGVAATAVGVLVLTSSAAGGHGVAGNAAAGLLLTGSGVAVTFAPVIGVGAGLVRVEGGSIGEIPSPIVVTPGGGGAGFYVPLRTLAAVGIGAGVLGPIVGRARGEVGGVVGKASGRLALGGLAVGEHGTTADAKGRVTMLRGAASGWSQHPIEDDLIEALLAAA